MGSGELCVIMCAACATRAVLLFRVASARCTLRSLFSPRGVPRVEPQWLATIALVVALRFLCLRLAWKCFTPPVMVE